MDEDKKWEFDAPQHYCDLPSAVTNDDSELADQYFFAKADDTVYFEPNDDDTFPEICAENDTKEQFPVIRRRSLSVGSKPLKTSTMYESVISGNLSTFKKPLAQQSTNIKSVDDPSQHFVGGLRAYNTKASGYEALKVTKPVPFNLTISKKKVHKTASENPSLAEGVRKWEKKTPERFHTNRHGEPFRFTERVELRPTQPHTPQLTAVKRHRTIHVLSREEQEKREVEEMKKNQFKAHNVDEKVFKPPVLPAKKELKKTKVEPFHLTESHKKENVPPPEPAQQEFHFHAKPAPKFDVPAPIEKKPPTVTVPQTPKFSEAGKASLQQWRRQRSRSNGSVSSSMRSGSSNGSLNSCGLERLKSTKIAPFSFEDRDKMLQKKKEMAIKKALEEEKKQREFHANPCPNFSLLTLKERPTFTATRPAPFQLSCETRGQSKKEKFQQQLEELRLEEKKAAQFKAQPATILNKEPFKLKHDQTKVHVTQVAEFNLTTEKRIAERKTFEQFLKEKEQEKEAARLQREQEKLRQQEEELVRLREEATFHAKPIRQYKAIDIKKAEVDLLTVPKTPKFLKKPH